MSAIPTSMSALPTSMSALPTSMSALQTSMSSGNLPVGWAPGMDPNNPANTTVPPPSNTSTPTPKPTPAKPSGPQTNWQNLPGIGQSTSTSPAIIGGPFIGPPVGNPVPIPIPTQTPTSTPVPTPTGPTSVPTPTNTGTSPVAPTKGAAPGAPAFAPPPAALPPALAPTAPSLVSTPAALSSLLGRGTSSFQQPSATAATNNPILAAIQGSITTPRGPAMSVPGRAPTPFGASVSPFSPEAAKTRWLQANGLI